MVRLVLGIVLAGAVMFVWGAVWWMALPFENMVMKGAADEPGVLAALGDELPETGVYFLPMPDPNADDGEAEMNRVTELQARGPIAQVFFRKEGVAAMSAATMGIGFLHLLAVAAAMAGFLKIFGQGLETWGRRAGALVGVAVVAVVMIDLGNPIWFHHPWDYWVVNGAFDLTSLAFGGAVVAWFVRPAEEPAAVTARGVPAAATG